MITEKNLFESGVLVGIHSGSYEGRRKLDPEQLKDLPQEIVRGVHDLFEAEFKNLIQDIKRFDTETRSMVKRKSIPFPFGGVYWGVYFVKSTQLDAVIELMDERILARGELISRAVDNYDAAIDAFASAYPVFYEKAKGKYLSKREFAERFYFNYQLIKITAPDKNSMLTAEQYKREREKFRQTIEEMKKEVVSTIYEALLEMTSRLKDQCTDGKPNQRTFNSLNRFLEQIDEVYSDFIDRDDIKDVIAKIRAEVLGVNAETLRNSEDLKKDLADKIKGIVNDFQALPDIPMKRAIDF
jgi:hypothetical protein